MSSKPLERRIADLEADVAQLKVKLVSQHPWWEQIAGAFADDPAFKQAMKLGQAFRRSTGRGAKQAKRRNVRSRH